MKTVNVPLTYCSVNDVENARSSAVAMKETVRHVPTARTLVWKILVGFFE